MRVDDVRAGGQRLFGRVIGGQLLDFELDEGERALGGGLWCRLQRRIAIERDFVGEFPVTRLHVTGSRNHAIVDLKRVRIDAEAIGRRGKKNPPDLGAGLADRASRLLDGEAARGDALVGTSGRRGAHHLHAADIDVEFVGGDLRERGHDALSDLDLAG